MKFYQYTIVFQEVPDEITLAFEITNCPHKCEGCHSPHLMEDIGTVLTMKLFKEIVNKYFSLISNVAFFGGEDYEELQGMLEYVKELGLKTTLWAGSCDVDEKIKKSLNYLKTGSYQKEFGSLYETTTNQRYFNLETGERIYLKK